MTREQPIKPHDHPVGDEAPPSREPATVRHANETPRLEVISSFDRLLSLRNDWELLVGEHGSVVESTWDFVTVWWRHFGEGRKSHSLHLVVCWVDAALVGIFPTYLFRGRVFGLVPLAEIRTIGDDIFSVSCHPKWRNRAWTLFLQHLGAVKGEWDVLRLRNVDFPIAVLSAYPADPPSNDPAWTTRSAEPKPILHLPTSMAAYLKSRNSHFKSNLKRRHAKLSRIRTMGYEQINSADNFDRDYGDFLHLHIGRRLDFGDKSLFSKPDFARYYQELTEVFLRKGLASLYFLKTDGRRCAVVLAFRKGSTLTTVLTGLKTDPEEHQCGPGILLDTFVIEQSINEGLTDIDYGRGVYPYKYELGGLDQQATDLHASRRGLACLKSALYRGAEFLQNLTGLMVIEYRMLLAIIRARGLLAPELRAHVRTRSAKALARFRRSGTTSTEGL